MPFVLGERGGGTNRGGTGQPRQNLTAVAARPDSGNQASGRTGTAQAMSGIQRPGSPTRIRESSRCDPQTGQIPADMVRGRVLRHAQPHRDDRQGSPLLSSHPGRAHSAQHVGCFSVISAPRSTGRSTASSFCAAAMRMVSDLPAISRLTVAVFTRRHVRRAVLRWPRPICCSTWWRTGAASALPDGLPRVVSTAVGVTLPTPPDTLWAAATAAIAGLFRGSRLHPQQVECEGGLLRHDS